MTLKNKHLKTFIQVRIFLYQSTRFKGQWQEKIGSFQVHGVMQHVLTKDAILNLILRCQHFFYCRLACRKNCFFERRTTVFVCTVCLHQPSTQPHIKTTVIIQDHFCFDKKHNWSIQYAYINTIEPKFESREGKTSPCKIQIQFQEQEGPTPGGPKLGGLFLMKG